MPRENEVPTSTYRLLLKNGITFHHLTTVVPYLKRLGVDSVSVSSVFNTNDAGNGRRSFDPTVLDQKSGGEQGFALLSQSLKQAGISLLIDINPNQIPVSHENNWWRSLLEWGQQAKYASYFDIDWSSQLGLPVLERPLAEELDAGLITLAFDTGAQAIGVSHSGNFYPLSPLSYTTALKGLDNDLSGKLQEAIVKAGPLDPNNFRENLRMIYGESSISDRLELANHLNKMTSQITSLKTVLAEQHWVLTTIAEARSSLSYRHSYDSLYSAGAKVERPEVFDDFHRTALELLKSGAVSGFRVNQIDGLADPAGYLKQLRYVAGKDAYIVTDKIFLNGESQEEWSANGTAGYEFISATSNVLIDHARLPILEQAYATMMGMERPPERHYRDAKRAILHKKFAPEFQASGDLLLQYASDDVGELEVRQVVSETITELPVFRTYSNDRQHHYAKILETAGLDRSVLPSAIYDEFDTRYQQLSAAVMAQAVEESYRYDRGPITLDEITVFSADAEHPVEAFHKHMAQKAAAMPLGMNATSFSYATKFGEDARMRLLALTEAPEVWAQCVSDWRIRFAGNVKTIEAALAPHPETEWLIYQTMAAIWPPELHLDDQQALMTVQQELTAFVIRAVREMRKDAFWTETNRPYELAIADYIGELFLDRDFLTEFADRIKPYWVAGAVNSLTQTVLKLTTPGIPVIQTGSETWDFSISQTGSPDALGFEKLGTQLNYAEQSPLVNLLSDWHSGAVKQRVITMHLRLRQQHPALFQKGEYIPLKVSGVYSDHLVAFMRRAGSTSCVVAVPRLPFESVSKFQEPFMPVPVWGDTTIHLPEMENLTTFENILTGETITPEDSFLAADAMREFSTATLIAGVN
ncbi:malto-oligosyltrehalose synthase [Phyllobacterium sp. SB3]|uniref:malto-oligosyltrehalose synthase n=1 Tax=Phyllobacterium sp. SB3 TaxID=3156073 RepID=UPI0032AFA29E